MEQVVFTIIFVSIIVIGIAVRVIYVSLKHISSSITDRDVIVYHHKNVPRKRLRAVIDFSDEEYHLGRFSKTEFLSRLRKELAHSLANEIQEKIFIVIETSFETRRNRASTYLNIELPIFKECKELCDHNPFLKQVLTRDINEPVNGLFEGQGRGGEDFIYNDLFKSKFE